MVKSFFFFSSQCHYVVIPSRQGCPSKPAARQRVPPPLNAETVRCGRRHWTSIRRAHSPPKRSRDKRFCTSFQSLTLSNVKSTQSRKSNLLLWCLSCSFSRQFMSFTGESKISSKISNLPERLEHFYLNYTNKSKYVCTLCAHIAVFFYIYI